jgi:hypothetical protein
MIRLSEFARSKEGKTLGRQILEAMVGLAKERGTEVIL